MRLSSRKSFGVATTSVVLGLAASAPGAAPTPAGLSPGDRFHLVFVTNGSTTAVNDNLGDYDTFVTAEATAAGLNTYGSGSVTWQALASANGGGGAIGRFNPSAGVFRLDGAQVASDGADLWDESIGNSINITPTLSTYNGFVWTGTNALGAEDKGLGSENVLYGTSSETGAAWMNTDNAAATGSNPIYAFSSELEVPIPEPTSLGLVAMLASLLGLRRR